ncbi:guanine nucleotide-binding protein alpha-1 subunit [Planoprotostelium fungivorum]|uniref:Guanine nucleotide-binding protein alpha-1 subunit n=1 Tax=Planoprotostelium fungivorum TaxID=1890364 RepID=A0A2P6NF70_9EUKA|nr:guanine nucleotide-binding protein alpha-1 subunit [Planoprotostelium fungivorum]
MCFGGSLEERKESDRINRELERDRKRAAREVKLLLLGAGDCGKSTIAKQIRIMHLGDYKKEELVEYTPIIVSNVLNDVKSLLEAREKLAIEWSDPNNEQLASEFTDGIMFEINQGRISSKASQRIDRLWSDSAIQTTLQKTQEFHFGDSTEYFLKNVKRIAKENYVPTQEDMIRSRAKTTGVSETRFQVGSTIFQMVDVGGQRSERRKWMHCFQGVSSVLFCVSLSDYDQMLYEDEKTNRMHESLTLFRDVCTSKWFSDTAMVIFFNKKDIFEKKINTTSLRVCFPSYTGADEYEEASNFVISEFKSQSPRPETVYAHRTCATDTEDICTIFKSIQEIVLSHVLNNTMMIT